MSTEDFKMTRLPQEATHTTANFRMSRRHLLTRVAPAGLAGTVLATVSSPALAWASLDMNSKRAHARSPQQSQSAFYAAIFEQRNGPAWVARHGLSADQYQQTFTQLVGQGYRLLWVSGYGV
jgi:hypothetical protein